MVSIAAMAQRTLYFFLPEPSLKREPGPEVVVGAGAEVVEDGAWVSVGSGGVVRGVVGGISTTYLDKIDSAYQCSRRELYIHEPIDVEIKCTVPAGWMVENEGVLGISEVNCGPNGARSDRHVALKICGCVRIGNIDVLRWLSVERNVHADRIRPSRREDVDAGAYAEVDL